MTSRLHKEFPHENLEEDDDAVSDLIITSEAIRSLMITMTVVLTIEVAIVVFCVIALFW